MSHNLGLFQNGMFSVTEQKIEKRNNPSRQITAGHKLIPTRCQVALVTSFL